MEGARLVAVVTDSAANVPADVARDLGIAVAPLGIRFGDRAFSDGVDMGGPDFYALLTTEEVPASTAAPSPGDYLEAYQSTGADRVLCVTLGSGLSVANRQALLAAEQFGGQVEVVDSGSATMGEGFVAIQAARVAREGADLAQVAAKAKDVAGRVRVLGAIDTFEYLRRGGRVSKLQAYAATKLDIKPVFRLEEGEIRPVARSRTRGRALARIIQEVLREVAGRPVHLAGFHARAEDDAAGLVDGVAREAEVVERFVVECTPAIGAHTGPGLAGLAFFCEAPLAAEA
jgi:fatty acid kinase fatty acid binding subunit